MAPANAARTPERNAKARSNADMKYSAMLSGNSEMSEVLRFSKSLVADKKRFRTLVGADSAIAWSDVQKSWINSDTKQELPPNNIESCGGEGDCTKFFKSCLMATNATEAESAANKCMDYISKAGPEFFEKMNNDVHNMHPDAAVSFLQSVGFRGRRVNFMDAFETVDSWTRNLSLLMGCTETSPEVCNILNNLKLMEYIRSVWNHVHSNPAILNNNSEFVGTHDVTKDNCCDTNGFNIHKKKNVPGNRVSINRLLYKIRRDNRLRFAMLGIPTQLLHVNVLTGMHGGSLDLLNQMKSYNFQTGGNVVNEFLKMTPTAARRLSEVVELTVKSILKSTKDDAEKTNNVKEAHELIMKDLTKLSDSERKIRQLTVAWSVLADKVALSGSDVIPENLKNNLMKVFSAIQRYTVKASTRTSSIASQTAELAEEAEDLANKVEIVAEAESKQKVN
jgi:hypothetical protein